MRDITSSEFYLGRKFDSKQLYLPSEKMRLDSPFSISPYDLLTHLIILGMTGSGKTILGKIIIEEAALHGIPSILIDPKGDLSSMGLVFPSLNNEEFIPWVETRRGEKKEHIANNISELYDNKLKEFYIPKKQLVDFNKKTRIVILTPRSTTGIPLAISSLPSPPQNVKALIEIEPETVLNLIDSVVRTLLMRLFPRESSEKHRIEEKFLNDVIRYAWENSVPLEGIDGLATLVELVENPPLKKIGVMDVDSYISPKDRHELAININNLLVGVEQLWHIGINLEIELLLDLYSKDDKTPIIIFNLSEIPNLEDKIFVVSRIAYAVYEWMRRKGGSGDPRLIFYIDEIGGGGGKTAFFPIHPYNPPSKPPLMLLIKQARAFGVCCVFSTQNPGDIDYKGLSNCGTWIIGKLSTSRDREKVLQGLGDIDLFGTAIDRRTLNKQIATLETGEFLCKTKQGDVEFFKERWLMSYHKTMTSKDIRQITNEKDRRIATSTIPLLSTKRAFLKLNYPASLNEIRNHFREGIETHVIKADCSYKPILFFNIKSGFRKRHAIFSKEIKTELVYGPILVPLFLDTVDIDYVKNNFNIEKIRTKDLKEEFKDDEINIISKKMLLEDVISETNKLLIGRIKKILVDDLNVQIKKEKEQALESEKMNFQPKLEDIDFETQNLYDQVKDVKMQISQLENEIKNLEINRSRRRSWGEPIVMITKSINSRERKIKSYKTRISRYESKINLLNSQKNRIMSSLNDKMKAIKEQFDNVEKNIYGEITPELLYENAFEIYVPICNAEIIVKNKEKSKPIQLTWNGYNGARVSTFSCYECGTHINQFSSIYLCQICLEPLCDKHAQICNECGIIICSEHSWSCRCGSTHCISEESIKCKECESLLCEKCKLTCEICGASLCLNHINVCAICGKNVCNEHLWVCGICGKIYCNEESSYLCSIGQHLLCDDCKIVCDICNDDICKEHSIRCPICGKIICQKDDHFTTCVICEKLVCNSCIVTCEGCGKPLCPEHHVNCPSCGSLVCESCLKTQKRFLGLSKRQKCVLCL